MSLLFKKESKDSQTPEFTFDKDGFIEWVRQKDEEDAEKTLESYTSNLERIRELYEKEEAARYDFVPDMRIESRKYGDYLIINSVQTACDEYSGEESHTHSIRLDSVTNFSHHEDYDIQSFFHYQNGDLSDDEKMIYPFDKYRSYSEISDLLEEYAGCTSEEAYRLIINSPDERLGLKNKKSYSTAVGDVGQIEIHIHEKYSDAVSVIECSPMVIDKVIDALENVLVHGNFDPERYHGEK